MSNYTIVLLENCSISQKHWLNKSDPVLKNVWNILDQTKRNECPRDECVKPRQLPFFWAAHIFLKSYSDHVKIPWYRKGYENQNTQANFVNCEQGLIAPCKSMCINYHINWCQREEAYSLTTCRTPTRQPEENNPEVNNAWLAHICIWRMPPLPQQEFDKLQQKPEHSTMIRRWLRWKDQHYIFMLISDHQYPHEL